MHLQRQINYSGREKELPANVLFLGKKLKDILASDYSYRSMTAFSHPHIFKFTCATHTPPHPQCTQTIKKSLVLQIFSYTNDFSSQNEKIREVTF